MHEDLGPTTDNARNKKVNRVSTDKAELYWLNPDDPDSAVYILNSRIYFPGTQDILIHQLEALEKRGVPVYCTGSPQLIGESLIKWCTTN